MGITIGACSQIENGEILADSGFKYIELALSAVARMDEVEYREYQKKISSSPLKPEVFNLFVPGDVRLVGEERSEQKISAYLELSLDRASELGARIVVFGSGGARHVPDGYDRSEAMKELAAFCVAAGDEAERHDITIAIEPLRKAESNIINGTAEGLELAKMANHPRITVLIDYYHVEQDNEPVSCVIDAGDALTHTHIARGDTRAWPKDPDESPYRPFFANLKSIGYEGRMSVEGKVDDLATEGPVAYQVLKALAEESD